jgi:hypothetical protein
MIKPEDIISAKRAALNPVVEKAVDFLIAYKWNGYCSKFTLRELKNKIVEMSGHNATKEMLNFESIYREHGWKVSFDTPGYHESYESSWTFTKK